MTEERGKLKEPPPRNSALRADLDFESALEAARAMRKDRPQATDADPLFVSMQAARLDYANVYNRTLKPAMRKAGISWGGAHRLRHTTATHLIRSGASANQAQLWLGHHDPGFTARTYVHLDSNDLPDPEIFASYFEDANSVADATTSRQLRAVQGLC